jgi:hypothetical protein
VADVAEAEQEAAQDEIGPDQRQQAKNQETVW